MKIKIFLVIVFSFIFSIAFGEEPIKVNLSFLGAVVAPTKENGKPWDGFGGSNPQALSSVQKLLSAPDLAVTTAISTLGQISKQGTSAPDVIGYVEQTGPTINSLVNVAGIPIALATKQTMNRDNYTPSFNVTYEGWPIFKNSRFRIHLVDADLTEDDPIGTVEISYNDVMKAIKEGKTTPIKVADQSFNQLLYILISATKSLSNTPPKIDGYRYP